MWCIRVLGVESEDGRKGNDSFTNAARQKIIITNWKWYEEIKYEGLALKFYLHSQDNNNMVSSGSKI